MKRLALPLLILASVSLAASALAAPRSSKQAPKARLVSVNDGVALIDDAAIQSLFVEKMTKLADGGKTVPVEDLVKQAADRKDCLLDLPAAPQEQMTPAQIYERSRESVLVLGTLFKCPKCTKWHPSCCAGFPVTDTGVILTNYHVIGRPNADKDNRGLCAMTSAGDMFVVTGVIAASAREDFALLQLDGVPKVKPLSLSPNEPVGNDVTLISHPDGRFFTLTNGLVSRYAMREAHTKGIQENIEGRSEWMMITADYAKGSSGSPVFNDHGAVVGMVSRTNSIYYKVEEGIKDDFQMTDHMCVPASAVLKVTGGEQ